LTAAVFLVTVISYLLLPIARGAGASAALVHFMILLAVSVPFTFWALAQAYFDDEFEPTRLHWFFGAALVGTTYLSWLVLIERQFSWGLSHPVGTVLWALVPKALA